MKFFLDTAIIDEISVLGDTSASLRFPPKPLGSSPFPQKITQTGD